VINYSSGIWQVKGLNKTLPMVTMVVLSRLNFEKIINILKVTGREMANPHIFGANYVCRYFGNNVF